MSPRESLAADLDLLVRREQREKRLPSVAAAVVRDGETVWETAVGAADVAAGAEAKRSDSHASSCVSRWSPDVCERSRRSVGVCAAPSM